MAGNDDFPSDSGPSPIATPAPKGAAAPGKSADDGGKSVQESRDRAIAAAEARARQGKTANTPSKPGQAAAPKSTPKASPKPAAKPSTKPAAKGADKSADKGASKPDAKPAANLKSKAGAAPAQSPSKTDAPKPRRRFVHRDAEPTGTPSRQANSAPSRKGSEYAEPGDEDESASSADNDEQVEDQADEQADEQADSQSDDESDDQADEPEADVSDESDAEQDSESESETDEETDDLDTAKAAALHARGRALGLTNEDLTRFGGDVEQIVAKLERDKAQQRQDQQPDELPELEDVFKEHEADLDPKLVGSLRKAFSGLHENTKKLHSTIKDLRQQIHHQAIAEEQRELDSAFNDVGETMRPLIGKGATPALAQDSEQFANRVAVIQEVVAIRKVYHKAGMPMPPLRELVRRAIGSLFHDRIEQLARQRIASKVQKRQKTFTAPPTRRKSHAPDATREERAVANVRAQLRELGDDEGDEF